MTRRIPFRITLTSCGTRRSNNKNKRSNPTWTVYVWWYKMTTSSTTWNGTISEQSSEIMTLTKTYIHMIALVCSLITLWRLRRSMTIKCWSKRDWNSDTTVLTSGTCSKRSCSRVISGTRRSGDSSWRRIRMTKTCSTWWIPNSKGVQRMRSLRTLCSRLEIIIRRWRMILSSISRKSSLRWLMKRRWNNFKRSCPTWLNSRRRKIMFVSICISTLFRK